MKTFNFTLLLVLMTFSLAQARENCLEGNHDARVTKAKEIIQNLIRETPFPANETLLRKLPVKSDAFPVAVQLAMDAKQRACEYTDDGRFINVGQLIDSMVNHFEKSGAKMDSTPEMPVGFKMAIIPSTAPNFIFVEVTNDGFVFHVCGKDDKDFTRSKVYPSTECRTVLSEGMFIPQQRFLHGLSGFKHFGKVFLKIVAQMSVVVTSSLGAAVISPVASGVATYLNPDSMARIKKDFEVQRLITEMLKLESYSEIAPMSSDHIFTRAVPYTFDDLYSSLNDVLTVMAGQEFRELKRLDANPGNPSLQDLPALRMQRKVYEHFNELYREGKNLPGASESGQLP